MPEHINSTNPHIDVIFAKLIFCVTIRLAILIHSSLHRWRKHSKNMSRQTLEMYTCHSCSFIYVPDCTPIIYNHIKRLTVVSLFIWWAMEDSNLPPPQRQCGALAKWANHPCNQWNDVIVKNLYDYSVTDTIWQSLLYPPLLSKTSISFTIVSEYWHICSLCVRIHRLNRDF